MKRTSQKSKMIAVYEMFSLWFGRPLKRGERALINKAFVGNPNMDKVIDLVFSTYSQKSVDIPNDDNQVSIEAYLGRISS